MEMIFGVRTALCADETENRYLNELVKERIEKGGLGPSAGFPGARPQKHRRIETVAIGTPPDKTPFRAAGPPPARRPKLLVRPGPLRQGCCNSREPGPPDSDIMLHRRLFAIFLALSRPLKLCQCGLGMLR